MKDHPRRRRNMQTDLLNRTVVIAFAVQVITVSLEDVHDVASIHAGVAREADADLV